MYTPKFLAEITVLYTTIWSSAGPAKVKFCCCIAALRQFVPEVAVTFLHISRKPDIDLILDCIFGKPMKHGFQ